MSARLRRSNRFGLRFGLRLVLDEVDLRLAGRWCGNRGGGHLVVDLFLGLLDEHIDDGLLLGGLLGGNVLGGSWGWLRSWSLDEDDLVVLLSLDDLVHLGLLDLVVLGFWWGNVNVDGLLDDGGQVLDCKREEGNIRIFWGVSDNIVLYQSWRTVGRQRWTIVQRIRCWQIPRKRQSGSMNHGWQCTE